MSPYSDFEWEALLERVVTGDAEADAADVRAMLSGHPERAAELEDLLAIRQRLADDGAEERATFALANQLEAEPAPEGREAGPRRPGARRRWPLVLVGLIASTAAVSVLYLGLGRTTTGSAPADQAPFFLGTGLALEHPVVPDDDLSSFQWQFDRATTGTTYHLRIWRADAAPGDPPTVEHRYLVEPRYAPTEQELELLGPTPRWEVSAIDASGRVAAHGSASASR